MDIERIALPEPGETHVWRVALSGVERQASARQALREILAGYLGGTAEEVALVVGERGKPRLAGPVAQLSFNLSHSGGLALVAVASGGVEVGVDVELIRPRGDLVRLAARWLPAEDAKAVAAASQAACEGVFYAAWTRYEARAKCTGAGISGPRPGPEIVALQLEIDPGYAAAVAVKGPQISVQRFEADW